MTATAAETAKNIISLKIPGKCTLYFSNGKLFANKNNTHKANQFTSHKTSPNK
jgi:hypothetical protein